MTYPPQQPPQDPSQQPQPGQPQYQQYPPPSQPQYQQYPPQNPAFPQQQYGYQPPSSGHPVQLSIQRADQQSRLLALFSIPFFLIRMIAVLPAIIVLYFVLIAFEVVAWIGQWAILFTGSYPEGMHRFGTGVIRWQVRVTAFMFGLTDKYPPFTLQP